jgi:hypothetical protein
MICPVAASTMAFMKPRVPSTSRARANIGHGHLGEANLSILCARFRFRQADATKLRIDEDGIGNEAAFGADASLFEEICTDDAEIVVRNVREGRAALDVPQRVDSSHICFEFCIDLEETTLVCGDACGGDIERVRVR